MKRTGAILGCVVFVDLNLDVTSRREFRNYHGVSDLLE